MKKHNVMKRMLSLLLALSMVFAMLPGFAVAASAAEPADVERIYGDNRFATSFAIADTLKQTLGVEKFSAMIVTYGLNFPDALAGSYLAAQKNAPILLVIPSNIHDVNAYISANLASDGMVYLLGDAGVVSDSVADFLPDNQVKRLGGKTRFETNLEILKEVDKGVTGKRDLLVCTGMNFADSLSASATGLPILLVYTSLTAAQKEYLDSIKADIGNVFIIGGTGAVTEKVEQEMRAYGNVQRLAGQGREHTSVMVAEQFFNAPSSITVANSLNFPDGLCGGALAYAQKSPLILTRAKNESYGAGYVEKNGITKGNVLGGLTAVSVEVVNNVFIFSGTEDAPTEPSTPTEPAKTYTVTFMDYNGTVLKTEEVTEGGNATPPADPSREGYTFTGWSADYTNVTRSLTLIAQYELKQAEVTKYTVTFKDHDGTVLKTEEVEKGKAATAPSDPSREGYTFTGWDKAFTNVTADLTVTAQYTKDAHVHTPVAIPGKAPTTTEPGLTEGSKCSSCGEILIAQEEIPVLEEDEYTITYYLYNNDEYLEKYILEHGVDNSKNKTTYKETDSFRLSNLNGVPGYNFEGWYDGPGTSATKITRIGPGEMGDLELYAHWEKVSYSVMFKSDLIPVADEAYTVDKEYVLPVPKLDGYIFAGWSDDDGHILKSIPAGTTGHKTYTANWLSERNQAWAKSTLDDPIIYADDDVILFAYEIGEIRNVPVKVIHDFGKINSSGVSQTITKTYTKTTAKSEMDTYTNTISKATTDSFAWTLDSGWTNSTSVSEEWAQEQGMTVEEAEEVCTDESSNWYVSSGNSGTDTTETLDTKDEYDLKTKTANKKTYNTKDETTRQDFSAEVGVEYKSKVGVDVGLEGVGNLNASKEFGVGVDLKYENGISTTKKTGDESDEGSNDQTGSVSQTGTVTTNSSSWNKESGYGGSSSLSTTSSVLNALTESISQSTQYGKEYILSGDESKSKDHTSSESSDEEYSSSVVFETTEEESITQTWDTSNTMSGFHRWVLAGTAHVFGVAGYNIAEQSYFAHTISIMDSATYTYEDYSYNSGSYDDNQNGIIPFVIPTDIADYVSEYLNGSEGLEISKDGVITGYTGQDKFVVIPEYKVLKNLDGTSTSIKVTGISSEAFQGKDIVGIELSDFITAIPDRAFQNCTELKSFDAKGITSIGSYAFAGCTSLKACTLGDTVVSLGENAFSGMEYFSVNAANAAVAQAALTSGAKQILVAVSDACTDLDEHEIKVPFGTELFIFNGRGKTFRDLTIESEAVKTEIYNAKFESTGKTPLNLASAQIILQEVTSSAPGFAMVTSASSATIGLYGESYLKTTGENALLCKDIVLEKYQPEKGFYSHLYIDGTALICGDISGTQYRTITNGVEYHIDEETFNNYLKGTYKVTFDANGGTMGAAELTVYFGQKYGQLPVPTLQYYTFNGWFTEKEGGTLVTADANVLQPEDHTLYAQWTQDTFKVTFDAGEGTVNTDSKMVAAGGEFGELPEPTRDYHTFTGWYTAAEGGEEITAQSVMTEGAEMTLYAHWELNPLSEWTLASDVDEDAMIENTKWSYTLTTTTESKETSLEGYSQISSKWVQSGNGSQNYSTAFPGGFKTDHWIYTSFAKSKPYEASETTTNKREVSDVWGGYVYWHWMYDCGSYANTTGRAISPKSGFWDTYGNSGSGFNYKYFYALTSTTNCGYLDNNYCCSNNMPSYNCHSILPSDKNSEHIGTPRFFRFEYRTCSYTDYYKLFTYQKIEEKESTTEITASDTISNVMKWVQYRPKDGSVPYPIAPAN